MVDPEQMIARRIVDQYKKMFDFLDYKPVDDLLTAEELSEAFRDYQWPKANPEITDDLEYAKTIIKQYDSNNKNSINFLEFCKFMEDLWSSADLLQEQKCNIAFERSKEIFVRLFHWLDRDQDSFITPEDMIYGISRIMIRDVDMKEVQDVFGKYDEKKVGKINLDSFLLAIANGDLDKTFKDEFLTTTFMK
jgi:Ca2+-binding EF-hand superfamily protein